MNNIAGFGGINERLLQEITTSHQNVKQIALKLAEKEFLVFEKDDQDGRSIRLKLTEKSNAFWDSKATELELFLKRLFSETNHDHVKSIEELF